jgi:hypothetical protein
LLESGGRGFGFGFGGTGFQHRGFAGGLEFVELAEGFFEGALEALLVEGEVDEGVGVFAEFARGGEGGVDFGMVDVDVAGFFEVAEGEHAVFDGADSVQAPLGIDESLGELAFDGSFGFEAGEEFCPEGLVGGEVFGGEDDDASGESVAEGVEAGAAFAFGGAGSGGFAGIDFGGRHGEVLLVKVIACGQGDAVAEISQVVGRIAKNSGGIFVNELRWWELLGW